MQFQSLCALFHTIIIFAFLAHTLIKKSKWRRVMVASQMEVSLYLFSEAIP